MSKVGYYKNSYFSHATRPAPEEAKPVPVPPRVPVPVIGAQPLG
jgi:hypothetical protein